MTPALRLLVAIAIAAAGTVAAPAWSAAQPVVTARATLNTEQVRLGDRFSVTVTVQHPPDVLVNVDPPTRSAVLHLAEVRPRTATRGTSASVSRFEYVLAVFALGDMQLQPLRVTWLNAEGATGEEYVAVPPLVVQSASQPSDTELRPLKPQLAVAGAPPAWQRPAIAAGAVVAFAIVGALAWSRVRRRRPTIVGPQLDDMVAPEREARRRLDELATASPLARRDYDQYYGTISLVVREYLHERFGFSAHALTTSELQQRMVARGVERWQARLVGGLLDRCDGAVYAGRHPDPASADHDLTVAFEIIELSRPQPIAMPAGAAR